MRLVKEMDQEVLSVILSILRQTLVQKPLILRYL